MGFADTLVCSSCKKLEEFVSNSDLISECEQCCSADADDRSGEVKKKNNNKINQINDVFFFFFFFFFFFISCINCSKYPVLCNPFSHLKKQHLKFASENWDASQLSMSSLTIIHHNSLTSL